MNVYKFWTATYEIVQRAEIQKFFRKFLLSAVRKTHIHFNKLQQKQPMKLKIQSDFSVIYNI